MKILIMPRLLAALLLAIPMLANAGWDPGKKDRLLRAAEQTIEAFKGRDASIQRFFDAAAGWVVYPEIKKGAIMIGGAYGEGILFEAGKPTGYSELSQVSIGFQLGGKAYSELIFFADRKALDRFKSGKAEFDAQVSAVVIDKGAAAAVDYSEGVAIFVYSRAGLMAEAAVGGQQFTFEPLP